MLTRKQLQQQQAAALARKTSLQRGAIISGIVGLLIVAGTLILCAQGATVQFTNHFHVGSEVQEYALGPKHAVGREQHTDIGFIIITVPLDKSYHTK